MGNNSEMVFQYYKQMSDIYLCKVPWKFGYSDVYMPNKGTHTNRKAEALDTLNKIKSKGKHFGGCRPIAGRNSFILNIPFEDALEYNYVMYIDNDVMFRKGTTEEEVEAEAQTYDTEIGSIPITFLDTPTFTSNDALKAYVEADMNRQYKAYKVNGSYTYIDSWGKAFITSKRYEVQTQRTGGKKFRRYAFITDIVRVNDWLCEFYFEKDLWIQYVVTNGGIKFSNKGQIIRAMSQDPTNIKKWRDVHRIVPTESYCYDRQLTNVKFYEDKSGVWHKVGDDGVATQNLDTEVWTTHNYSEGDLNFGYKNMAMVLWVTSAQTCVNKTFVRDMSYAMSNYYDATDMYAGFDNACVVGGYYSSSSARSCMTSGGLVNGLVPIFIGRKVSLARISSILNVYGYGVDGGKSDPDNESGDQIIQITTVPAVFAHSICNGYTSGSTISDNNKARGVVTGFDISEGDWYQGLTKGNMHPVWYNNAELVVTDNCGTTQRFSLVDFHGTSNSTTGNPYFYLNMDFSPTSSIWCAPVNYKQAFNPDNPPSDFRERANKAFGFCLSELPNGSWSSDSYGAWIAQNGGYANMVNALNLSNTMTIATANSQLASIENQKAQNEISYYSNPANILKELVLDVATESTSPSNNQGNTRDTMTKNNGWLDYLTGKNVENKTLDSANDSIKNGVSTAFSISGDWSNVLAGAENSMNSANSALATQAEAISTNSKAQQALNELQLNQSIQGAKATADSGSYGQGCTAMAMYIWGLYGWVVTPCYQDLMQAREYVHRYGYDFGGKYVNIGTYTEHGGYNASDTSKYCYPLIGRKDYNYVQFSDLKLFNDVDNSDSEYLTIPDSYLSVLEGIFKTGVTIWHDVDTMYDYSTDNVIEVPADTPTGNLGDGFSYYQGTLY